MQSTFDRRRINGPEESFPPFFAEESRGSPPRNTSKARKGRTTSDIRPIFLQPGLISQANGSAYIETERTKIACSVYGPRQSKNTTYNEKGRLNVEVKFAPFSCERRRAPLRDAEDRSIAVAIQQALLSSIRLELFPKSSIDVFLIVIEADGIEGCVASGSIAASTALADAGIDMFGLVMSCSAAVVDSDIWIDPTQEESSTADGSIVLACMPALGTVTNVWQSGRMSPAQVIMCMEACETQCVNTHSVVAQALLNSAGTASI
ncbi:3' exoribonuclease family, domain 1-domain-containing protein [Rhodocollybia butyracea]|uniref:3' exoribonuclease family, domain 1-domain-containing protein n=1 Tax=Rhodocollybia butyracea TaxID=206335 RepID=A0A9P5U795_9AGAR|nr:3' exoribonuclease family, domain 1-domain-containing protein [Rhodocollybia butyracea]